jgi:NADPH-dependent 2,4-dienoyl-CoA reductase/sulfur reductase-like enzyme
MQEDLATSLHLLNTFSTLNGASPNMLRRILTSGRKPHICVIGAGFAGLRCADVLVQQGMKVTIFEARDRVGGRVCG